MMRRSAWVTPVAITMLCTTFAQADQQSVYFETNSTQLTAKAKSSLKRLATRIGSNEVKLRGSSDPRGSEEVNSSLRQERVRAVHDYLVSVGVPDSQISSDPGANGEGDPSSYWKLRNVSVSGEFAARPEPVATKTPTQPETTSTPPETPPPAPTKPAKPERETVAMNTPERKPDHGSSTGTETGTAENGKKLEPIKLIYWRSLNHALWIIAKQKGFFELEGFDATLQETDDDARVVASKLGLGAMGTGGVQSTHALERGQHQFTAGAVCGFAVHEAMSRGEPIVDIGSMIMVPETLVMKKELAAEIDKNIHAFKDKRIGDVSSGEGVHHFKYSNVLRTQLEKAGLKDDVDFKITEYADPSKEFKDLVDNKLDLVKVFSPADVEFTRTHPEYVRIPFAKYFPYLPCCRQIITRSQLKSSRGKYVRLLRASIRAHEFVIEHPREAADIIGHWLKLPPSVVRESIMSAYVTLTPDPMRKGVDLFQRTNDKYDGKKTSTAEFVDTSLYRDALLSLAKERDDAMAKGYYDTMIARFRANN